MFKTPLFKSRSKLKLNSLSSSSSVVRRRRYSISIESPNSYKNEPIEFSLKNESKNDGEDETQIFGRSRKKKQLLSKLKIDLGVLAEKTKKLLLRGDLLGAWKHLELLGINRRFYTDFMHKFPVVFFCCTRKYCNLDVLKIAYYRIKEEMEDDANKFSKLRLYNIHKIWDTQLDLLKCDNEIREIAFKLGFGYKNTMRIQAKENNLKDILNFIESTSPADFEKEGSEYFHYEIMEKRLKEQSKELQEKVKSIKKKLDKEKQQPEIIKGLDVVIKKMKKSNGDYMVGGINKEGNIHGTGMVIYNSSHRKLICENFTKGIENGFTIEKKQKDGKWKISFIGNYANGIRNGLGILYSEGNRKKFVGDFHGGLPHGTGLCDGKLVVMEKGILKREYGGIEKSKLQFVNDINFEEKLSEKIGKGGQGVVYKVNYQDQECALKIIKNVNYKEFQRELKVLSTLEHNNVVKILAIYTGKEDSFGIIYPFYKDSLEKTIKKINSSNYSQHFKDFIILRLILDVVHGLIFLHKNHISHRDIKPSNIMVNSFKEAVIVDFGSSRFVPNQKECYVTLYIGTLFYMPNPQADTLYGNDIFALATTIEQIVFNDFEKKPEHKIIGDGEIGKRSIFDWVKLFHNELLKEYKTADNTTLEKILKRLEKSIQI